MSWQKRACEGCGQVFLSGGPFERSAWCPDCQQYVRQRAAELERCGLTYASAERIAQVQLRGLSRSDADGR